MRDHLRQSRAIRDALVQWDPPPPQGTRARHLHPMAALISGLVARKSTQLPPIATHVPDGTPVESRVQRFARGGDNANIVAEASFLP
jgi:hypothetical protein